MDEVRSELQVEGQDSRLKTQGSLKRRPGQIQDSKQMVYRLLTFEGYHLLLGLFIVTCECEVNCDLSTISSNHHIIHMDDGFDCHG